MEEAENSQVILHYIDKLYEAMGKTIALAGRMLFLQTVLSLLLLSLSIGVITLEERVSMAGIGVKASLSVILTVGALGLTRLHGLFAFKPRHLLSV